MTTTVADLSSLDFWAQPARVRGAMFAHLRRTAPVSWQLPPTFGVAGMLGDTAPGYWLVTTHDLVRAVSRAPEIFCSGQGVSLDDVRFPPDLRELIGSFLVIDGARHATLRKLVSAAFTPRRVARIEAQIADEARRVVDRLLDVGECDFVDDVATPLPMGTIAGLIGVPAADRPALVEAAHTVVATSDPEFLHQGDSAFMALVGAAQHLWTTATALAAERRARPGDDLMTGLVQAEVDGQSLTDEEIGAFLTLLAVAGNDTTRNTTSHAAKALCDDPAQWAVLRTADPGAAWGTVVEEFIRWATPVIYFRRTATRDTVLGGLEIAAGDNVVLLYESANRDEAVFEDPWRFDVTRHPNEHLGFGGGGPHYCLGAHLARTQLRCLFRELATRTPTLTLGEPEYLASNFVHGVKRMPCRL